MCSSNKLLTVFSSEPTLDIERQTGWYSNDANTFYKETNNWKYCIFNGKFTRRPWRFVCCCFAQFLSFSHSQNLFEGSGDIVVISSLMKSAETVFSQTSAAYLKDSQSVSASCHYNSYHVLCRRHPGWMTMFKTCGQTFVWVHLVGWLDLYLELSAFCTDHQRHIWQVQTILYTRTCKQDFVTLASNWFLIMVQYGVYISYTPVRMEWAEGLRCSKVFSLLFCLATLTDINNNLYVCEHVWREPLKIYSFSRNELALGWVSQMGQGNQKVLRLWFRSFQWICWQQEKYWIFPALSFKLILTKVWCFCLPSVYLPIIILGRLCLRGRASVLLS